MRAAVKTAALILLVLSLGLHWAVLQTVAWTGMIISYSRHASFAAAVSQTFDGGHPCPMCKAIKQGRAEEKQQQQKQQAKPGSKMEIGLVWQATTFEFFSSHEPISSQPGAVSNRSDEPPKPRPRTA